MWKFILLFLIACSHITCTGRYSDTVEIHATNIPLGDTIPQHIEGAYFNLENNRFDFGKVRKKKIPHIPIEVEFSNTGKAPLLILKGDVSCGCLSVGYPKGPILPGQNGKLVINVDLRAQKGIFNKAVFIKTNADNDVVLIRVLGIVQ